MGKALSRHLREGGKVTTLDPMSKPAKVARIHLVESLTEHAKAIEADGRTSVLAVHLRQAANEISDLAELLDFRVVEVMADETVAGLRRVIAQTSDWEPHIGPVLVSNDGFQFVLWEGQPGGNKWVVTCDRKEGNAEPDPSKDPA